MSFSPLIVLFLQTGALLLVAVIAMRFARGTPAIRLMIGRVALLATVGLIALSPWTRLRKQPVVAVDWNPVGSVSRIIESLPTNQAKIGAVKHYPRPNDQIPSEDLDEAGFVKAVWLFGVLVLAAQLGFGWLSVLRVRLRSRPVLDARIVSLLESISKDAGVRVPSLVESDKVAGPVVSGVFRATIFLPPGFLDAARPHEVSAVLRHEVAHIGHADLGWQLFHRIVSIIAWPQPLIRALEKPMATASEELCDRQVLAAGIPAASYADCLLRLRQAVAARRTSAFGIGVVSRKRQISSRVEAILADRLVRTRVGRPMMLLLAVGAVVIALGATGVFAVPLQAKPDVVGPTEVHTVVKLIGPDGKPVTRAEAWLQVQGGTPTSRFVSLTVTAAGVELNVPKVPADSRGSLIVHAPGLGIALARIWPQPTPISSMRLSKATHISGRFRLADGSPAGQIAVRATRLAVGESMTDEWDAVLLDPHCPLQLTATSDGMGSFTIDDLAPGSTAGLDVVDDRYAQLRFQDEFKVPTDGSIVTLLGALRVPTDGSIVSRDFTLRRAAQFSGRIVRNGKPVAGVEVGAQSVNRDDAGHPNAGGWGEAVTDADGRFVIKRMAAGTYNIALKLDDKQQSEFTAVAHDSVALREGATVAGMDFKLIGGSIIRGRLVDLVGRPIANSGVGVYGPAHPLFGAWVQSTSTDADGRYSLRVPAGEQYVYTTERDAATNGQTVTVQDGTRTTVDFRR